MIGVKTGLDISSANKTTQEVTKLLADLQNLANRNPIRIQIQNTATQINSINNSIRNLGSSANSTSNSFKGLGSSISNLTSFYARWLSVSSAVNLALMQTRNAIKFAFEQDETVRNLSMITGESRKTVQGYTKDWNDLALELKQSTSIVSASNEEWARAGANMSEINELTKMTVKTSEIAGSNIKDTTSQAIALKNAYSLTNTELKKVLDGVVRMDNTSATGTDRLLRSLLVASASAKQAKEPLDWLVASLTTVQNKSKQTAESIGKNVRNINLNMTKMTSGADQVGLNRAEDMLNKINISMRINKDTFRSTDKILDDLAGKWKTLSEVQQAELSFSLAGKENSNTFNILMQNQAETMKNLINIKNANGAVDKAYEEHLISAKGSLGELKATLEHLYTAMVNGDVLKNVLNTLTEIVKVVEFLVTDGANLTKVWIGMLIAVKNFKLIEVGIMSCVTAFKYLTAFGLESLALLNLNPLVLGMTALIALVATITYSQYAHSKQVKELKSNYDLLNKAMSEMNGDEIKNNTEKLKEQQRELDKLVEQSKVEISVGFGVKDETGKQKLKEFIETLEEGGFTVDKVKNKIVELGVAEQNIATSDTIKSIQDKTNSTIEEATETQSLISQYQSLAQQENLSAEKKALLSGLSQQLVGRVEGLTTSVDKHGNMVITNTKHLSGQIDVLELLKQQAIITGNTEIEMAINSSSAIHNGTIQTLDDMKSKLISYQTLSSALSNSKAGKGGFFDTELFGLKMGMDNLEGSIKKIEDLKSKFTMKAPAISNYSSTNPSGYKPSATDNNDKADKQDIENLELKANKYYKLEGALKDVNSELERNNKLQNGAEGQAKIDLVNKEINLLNDKKKILSDLYKSQQESNRENLKALSSKGFTFDKNGQIANKNELLSSKTNSANKLTGDAKKNAIDSIKDLQSIIKNYEDLRFNSMQESSDSLYNLEQDRLTKVKEIATINKNIVETNENEVKEKVKTLLELEKSTKELKLENIRDAKIAKYNEELREFKKLHEAIIDGIDEEIQKNEDLNRLKAENEERTKRQIDLSKLQSKLNNLYILQAKELEIYNNKTREQFEENIKLKNDALQKQIDAINKTNEVEDEKEERLKRQNDLIKLQTELQNTQKEKNIKQLVKKDDGSFDFQFVADQVKIQELNEQIAEKQKENTDWEKDIIDKAKINALQSQIDGNNKIVEENAKTLSLLEKQLNGTVDGILGQINDLHDEIAEKQKDNNAWELSLVDSKNLARLEKEKKAHQDLITEEEASINNKKIIAENAYKAENFLLQNHYADMDALVKTEMGKLSVTYNNEWNKIISAVDGKIAELRRKYNESLALQNALSMGVTSSGSGGNRNYNGGDKDKVTINGKTWTGKEINDPKNEETLRLENIENNNKPIKIEKVTKGETGGYLNIGGQGMDGKGGSIMMVHPSELLLNKFDASTLLNIQDMMQNTVNARMSSFNNNIPQISNNTNNNPIVNNYKFGDISLPNVNNQNGVEDFVKGMKEFTHQLSNNQNFMARM